MRLLPSIAGLLAGLAAASGAAIQTPGAGRLQAAGILVQDRFLDETNRAALLCRTSQEVKEGACYKRVAVPGWFSNSLLKVLGRGKANAQDAIKPDNDQVLLPVYEMVGDHAEHQDHHVDGANKGALAYGHVGVVYLDGDGDFVLTDTATAVEHRVPIEAGKLISWPNTGFTHRVEGASPRLRRRVLGPMVFDAASNGLVVVGYVAQECTALAGYECVSPIFQPFTGTYSGGSITTGDNCQYACNDDIGANYSQWDGNGCYCSTTACMAFVPSSPSMESWLNPFYSCPALVLADPIEIDASSRKDRTTVRRGKLYTLQETMERKLQHTHTDKQQPMSTTNYAVLVTPPAGNAVTYRRTSVTPTLKPGTLRKPQVQTNGELLWPTVPMHRYATKISMRTFKVTFKVNKSATSPLVFDASVWKDGNKLQDATPVSVTVV